MNIEVIAGLRDEFLQVIAELTAAGTLHSTLIVVERSWVTDTPTFFELLREDDGVSELEYRMLRNWLDW